MKNIYIYIFIPCFSIFTILSRGQDFEYAMTQSDFSQTTINDMIIVGDRIYLGGSQNLGGPPLLIVFDTLGNLITYKTYAEQNDYSSGRILKLNYLDDQNLLQAVVFASPACDIGPGQISVMHVDENLNKIDSVILATPQDNEPFIFNFADSLFSLTTDQKTIFYKDDLSILSDLEVSEVIEYPKTFMINQRIFAFNRFKIDHLFELNDQGVILNQVEVPLSDQILVMDNYFLLVDDNGKIVKYSADLQPTDSLSSIYNNTSAEIFKVSNHDFGIAWHLPDGMTIIQFYSANFDLFVETPVPDVIKDEYRFLTKISGAYIYMISSCYPINHEEANQGLIPVLRRQKLSEFFELTRPSLQLLGAQVHQNLYPEDCVDSFCYYYGEVLPYEITVKNTGNNTIESFGHYVGTYTPSFCGGYYQEYHYYENLQLTPGEELTLQDTVTLRTVINAPALNFYIAGPNHMLNNSDTTVYTIEDITSSILSKSNFKSLHFYPNPVQDFLFIDVEELFKNQSYFKIISSTGKILKSGTFQGDRLSTQNIPPGLHYVKLESAESIYVGSFIKVE